MLLTDTIAAIATPPGEGGIAIVRVSGPGALEIGARVFRPGRGGDPAQLPGYSIHYGRMVDPRTDEAVDEGLLLVFRAPHSYTGEDTVELSCHGGAATTGQVLRSVIHAGARLAEPGEFTRRAFLHGRLDLAQAEAVADLIRARTESAQRLARRQLEGALSTAVRELRQELIGILAAIEVTIDFSDEVGELDYGALEYRVEEARAGVQRLLATAERGRMLREGVRVALLGRPNVGKSSLFNALLGENRAIVTELPGTTRDRLEETVNIGGVPMVLVDMAGIRETEDQVERVGVERAEAAVLHSDLLLWMLDLTTGITAADLAVLEKLAKLQKRETQEGIDPGRVLVLLNKRDAVSEEQCRAMEQEARQLLPARQVLCLSARTGEGLPDLEQALLSATCGRSGPEPAEASEAPVVSNVRHREALESALRSLQEAERTTSLRMPGDFIAIDARGALEALGLITGETVTDDIVHRIFRDFCVGK